VEQIPAGFAIITIQIARAGETYLHIRDKNRSTVVMQYCLNWFLPQRLKTEYNHHLNMAHP
jgi:hypothetical protein